VAVAIFMFVVGYELDLGALRGRRRGPAFVAGAALVVPMCLACLTVLAFRGPISTLAQHRIDTPFVLYFGLTMSITALPVLAAIVRERGIAGTLAGVTATSAAGLMDVVAWLTLAAVLTATTHKAGRPWAVTLLLFLAFLVVMAGVMRPVLRRWMRCSDTALANRLQIAIALGLGGAWVTAALGLHPVFGAFIAGLVMPTESGTPDPEVLRPLFFAVTGLALNVEAMNGTAFLLLGVVCLVAALGKLLPAYAGARLSGLPRGDASVVATLVNTRGLTELIALNVGLASGLIGPRMYAVLVLMALITTLMTAPLLGVLKRRAERQTGPSEPVAVPGSRALSS
jgi:Kef-type K+ transport system membrane component KefB